jgi:hypothetical protein
MLRGAGNDFPSAPRSVRTSMGHNGIESEPDCRNYLQPHFKWLNRNAGYARIFELPTLLDRFISNDWIFENSGCPAGYVLCYGFGRPLFLFLLFAESNK